MMKHIVLSLIFFNLSFISHQAVAQDAARCRATHQADIVAIFKRGIVQNENFKQAAAGPNRDQQQRLRKALEQYDEEQLMPCVRRASQLVASHGNRALLRALMELRISYANSADETISYVMGRAFAADPAAVERTMSGFALHERRLLARSIQAGWTNVRPDLALAHRQTIDRRLEKLLTSTLPATSAGP